MTRLENGDLLVGFLKAFGGEVTLPMMYFEDTRDAIFEVTEHPNRTVTFKLITIKGASC